MLKYSRQRESIKKFLSTRTDHPTADTIYLNLRQSLPNISLGTVYRNLALLVSTGEIVKISCDDNVDRFDWNTAPHYHFMCTACGCVKDLPMKIMPELDTLAKQYFDGAIDSHRVMFYGTCKNCLNQKENDSPSNRAIL